MLKCMQWTHCSLTVNRYIKRVEKLERKIWEYRTSLLIWSRQYFRSCTERIEFQKFALKMGTTFQLKIVLSVRGVEKEHTITIPKAQCWILDITFGRLLRDYFIRVSRGKKLPYDSDSRKQENPNNRMNAVQQMGGKHVVATPSSVTSHL